MKSVVVRNIRRAKPSIIAELASHGVATVHEAAGRIGLMQPYMRPIWRGAKIAGTAVTVLAQPGDNWMLHVAIEQCRQGDVLVVSVTAENSGGIFGGLLATSPKARRAGGLAIGAGRPQGPTLTQSRFPPSSRSVPPSGS